MRRHRPGSVLPTLGVCLIALFGFVALAVDLGMLAVSRTQCQNAADVAALVGARNLNNSETSTDTNRAGALAAARASAKANPHLSHYVNDAEIASIVAGQYKYDPVNQRFAVSYPGSVSGSDSWSAVHVELASSQPTYFMKVMGVTTMPTGAAATAVHRPRDIAFVLDFTGSMAFASASNWPSNYNPVEGLMNPDPAYPKFGHYSRYSFYQNSSVSTTSAASTSVVNRPNPLQMTGNYIDSPGSKQRTFSPNNHTVATSGGPPVIEDFYTAPGDPSTVNAATPIKNAFKMWSSGGYNAATGACPAPANFDTQSDSPVAYVGDKWPRTDGSRGGSGTWSTLVGNNFTDNGAKTLKEFLGSTLGARDLTYYTLPSPPGGNGTQLLPGGNTKDGGDTDANYYDAVWEKYGYDLDVSFMQAQKLFANKTVKVIPGTFQGSSMGPGYWGKTFFIWPPDPRFDTTANLGSPNPANPAFDMSGKPMCDWRRRFFLRGDGQPFNPQTDDINTILFATAAGHTLNTVSTSVAAGKAASNSPGYFRLNYPAIMAWLKTGPQTLPSNLRSGRILYYSTTPYDLTVGAAGNADDKNFWREYVHFVFGVTQFDATNAPLSAPFPLDSTRGYVPTSVMAGVEARFPFVDSQNPLSVSSTSAFTPSMSSAANPKPYMNYSDNVNRPRMHFWFGPASMLIFLRLSGTGEDRPWWSGTTHESQAWQLKVGVNSVLDDIRRNHPNDSVGIAGYATSRSFTTPLASMGQDYFTLKNILFFRKDTVADLKANSSSTMEHRPYDSSFVNMPTTAVTIPNSLGMTDSNSGLAMAFNLFSNSTTLLSGGNYGAGGRRGASKMVVFETDGRPNAAGRWKLAGTGSDTRYDQITGAFSAPRDLEAWKLDSTLNGMENGTPTYAVKVVERIVAPVSTTGTSGFSLPNAPARVYAVAFGDIFNGYDDGTISTEGQDALRFLLRVQQVGNTSPGAAGTADPPSASIPAEQIITGSSDVRISKMKTALERIAQSGVQVTLVE